MNLNLTHWPIMRILRLAVGLGCFYAYYDNPTEWFLLILGGIATLQALFNTGCSNGACEIESQSKSETSE